jgi:isopentenyl-diphosphate delta-isomerase
MTTPANDITRRKGDHIRLCLDDNSQSHLPLFADVPLPYCALPDCNLDEVSTTVTLFGKTLSQPLIISSMTGGTEHGTTINTNLARAAEATQVALGVGSQRIALEKEEAVATFKAIRQHAPTAFIFANMGAVQLNYGYTIDHYRRVVDMIGADALYLHLNPLQEAIQPGGDTRYKGLANKMTNLIKQIDVPVFIKEVGHGIDTHTAQTLLAAGAAGIDVAGVGGTSYAWVEAQRAHNDSFGEWFKEFGLSTEQAIRDIAAIKGQGLVIASGGIRTPILGYKAHLVGADLYASTQPFLSAALVSTEAVIAAIEQWQQALQIAMFTTNTPKWEYNKANVYKGANNV